MMFLYQLALFTIFSFELVKELGNRQVLKTSLESGKTLIRKMYILAFAVFPCHATFSYVMFELLYRVLLWNQSHLGTVWPQVSYVKPQFSLFIKLVSASANVIVTAYMYSTKQECSQPLCYIIVIALKQIKEEG